MITVGDMAAALDEFAPRRLAESWDNVGLLVGDDAAAVRGVLVAYDVTAAVLAEARAGGADVVVAFHPPIFRPLSRFTAREVAWQAARDQISLIATHTALDHATPGTSDFLAEALGLTVTGPLRAGVDGDLKLVVFVPAEAADAVAAALSAAGAGRIGAYAECSFRAAGVGTFRPLAGARPASGQVGELSRVNEVRLELVVPAGAVDRAVAALREAHPYEEVAYDLFARQNASDQGLGRLASHDGESLAAFVERVKTATGSPRARVVGALDRPVRTVALVAGSGASLLEDAARAGADVLVTGDTKHHDALRAARLGLALVDPGHWATERFVLPRTAAWLRARFEGVRVAESQVDGEPFAWR